MTVQSAYILTKDFYQDPRMMDSVYNTWNYNVIYERLSHNFSCECKVNVYIFTPWIEKGPQTKERIMPHASYAMSSLMLLTGVWVRGYLQGKNWLKDRCITNADPITKFASLMYSKQPAGSSTDWVSIPGNQLVWPTSRQLG